MGFFVTPVDDNHHFPDAADPAYDVGIRGVMDPEPLGAGVVSK